MDLVEQLVLDIAKKKELRSLQHDYVRKQVQWYMSKHTIPNTLHSKSAVYRKIIKEIRASLRRTYGLFREEVKTSALVDAIERLFSSHTKERGEILAKLLVIHASTRERLLYYKELYSRIFAITGQPKRLLDLGCGLNPFSVLFFENIRQLQYYVYDLSSDELDAVSLFFRKLHKEKNGFFGKAKAADLLDFSFLEKLPKADVAFLFKVADVLDTKGHKNTEEVLKRVPARFVVLSFATRTMSGKRMTAPRRRWVEWLCTRLGYRYTVFELGNEIFYVVEKG